MDFLKDLNETQRQSVEYIHGPVMVIAGAGSGKTRVLTYKIAYLIQNGWKPYNILALTFTNKAAGEMKERIGHLVGPQYAHQVWMGTFHSVFAKILRREADKISYNSNFTIYDTEDSKKIITDIIRRMNLDEKNTYKPGWVSSRISELKNKLISPSRYEMTQHLISNDRNRNIEYFVDIYKAYQKQLYKNGAMDFDDLLYYTNVLFRDFPEVLRKYQDLFKYVLVDEFQDTNFAQYLAVKQLALQHKNICVVGDDAQSIYSFRGADINNIITNFRRDFPNHQLFKLEENYRSTQYIVEASNFIIKNNKNQIPKEVYTNNSRGEPIDLYGCVDENHEAEIVAKEILNLVKNNHASYSDISILYRTNAQSRTFEEVFRKYHIPYKIYGGMSFYQRKEIKDVLAYFRVVVNPKDEEALTRIINFPSRGIGDTSIEKMINYAYDNQISLFELMQNVRLLQNDLNISNKQVNVIENFITNIIGFNNILYETSVEDIAKEILNFSGIIKHYESSPSEENRDRILNIKELVNAIEQFAKTKRTLPEESVQFNNELPPFRTLEEFMREVSLLTSQDEREEMDVAPKVVLMTIHLSKGLEFPYVFVVGMEDGLFPSIRSAFSEGDVEEERRLFYVAVTRAKKKVCLSYAQKRFINGRSSYSSPSRFINELPPTCLNIKSSMADRRQFFSDGYNDIPSYQEKTIKSDSPRRWVSIQQAVKSNMAESSNFSVQNKDLQKGNVVYHDKFGRGTVLDVVGKWPDSKAIVYFDDHGQKVLLLKFAKLEKVE
ncbi:MAG: ATP-dependent DNA helicase [Bacteroidetes bacterium]|nr:MAG: ATP-dependent DNA helicase [Bacteroidota bacterium]